MFTNSYTFFAATSVGWTEDWICLRKHGSRVMKAVPSYILKIAPV